MARADYIRERGDQRPRKRRKKKNGGKRAAAGIALVAVVLIVAGSVFVIDVTRTSLSKRALSVTDLPTTGYARDTIFQSRSKQAKQNCGRR